MRQIILVQHCQSEHHINELSGGWTDTPLTKLGQEQANLIGNKLKEWIASEEYIFYSSDLMRAKQTAEIISSYLNLNIVEEIGLREINNGIATGKTKDWVKQNQNPRSSEYYDVDYLSFEGAETPRSFYNRICMCMDKIYRSSNKNILIVTHGVALSNILAWWLDLEVERLKEIYFSALPGSISILSKSIFNQNAVKLFNDTSHL